MAVVPVKTGVIGCGNISSAYLSANAVFEAIDIVACADLDADRANAQAEAFGIARSCSVDELLADPEIELVLNLTVPKAHASVNLAAIAAGKSVHTEKPFAVEREDGLKVLAAAEKAGVRVGGAPDTFLGDGGQTARKLLDDGAIGRPLAATAFMMCRGHESWHPSPEFYYEKGGGPLFDMGPYYLTALVNLLGPVKQVAAIAGSGFSERKITSEPKAGKIIPVETPTHVSGTLAFANGAIVTVVMSFDVPRHRHSCIELYGTEGSMVVPDPNGFGGTVQLFRMGQDEDFAEAPNLGEHPEYQRGVGAADLAMGLRTGRPHRVNGELAAHVLEVMHAFLDSSESGQCVEIQSRCQRPAAIPSGLGSGELDS